MDRLVGLLVHPKNEITKKLLSMITELDKQLSDVKSENRRIVDLYETDLLRLNFLMSIIPLGFSIDLYGGFDDGIRKLDIKRVVESDFYHLENLSYIIPRVLDILQKEKIEYTDEVELQNCADQFITYLDIAGYNLMGRYAWVIKGMSWYLSPSQFKIIRKYRNTPAFKAADKFIISLLEIYTDKESYLIDHSTSE